ncbi:MAG: hypothetical protein K9J12_14165 [Melioribacteraceae bacterium]|nr:hypothetical protein [Melioribacteraceae bacterium]MCF8263789.1 hypothetical protein [Melioribacteraceae bacterium]
MKSLLVCLLFSTSNFIHAQELFFAANHDKNGNPIVSQTIWEMKPWGVTIDIVYNNGESNFNFDNLYLYIDKLGGDDFVPFDSKALTVNKRTNWISYLYEFKEEGTYNVLLRSSDQRILAEKELTIKIAERFVSSEFSHFNFYYRDLKMYFCDWVINEKPVNVREEISLYKDRGKVVVYLKQKNPLMTDTLIVDVWRQNENSNDFDEFIQTKRFGLEPQWPDAFFKYRFRKPGEYKIAVYSDNSKLMHEKRLKVVK